MPEEIFILSLISIVAGSAVIITIIRAITGVVKSRLQKGDQGASLTASELRRLMGEAVLEAVGPLEKKIERLEAQVARRGLPGLPEHEEGTAERRLRPAPLGEKEYPE